MTPFRTTKTPAESLSYLLQLDGCGFDGAESIVGVSLSASGVTATDDATTPTTYQYVVSGGTAGRTGLVRVVLTTSLGNVHEVEHTVVVVR